MKLKKINPEKRVLIVALIIDLIAAIVAYFMGYPAWALGFLYGYLITAINFIAMALAAVRYVKMDPEGARLAAMGSYFGRMLFIAVAIILLKFWTAINVWATMLGFFALRLALLLEGVGIFGLEKRGENNGS